jgi:hypothetical protein
MPTRSWSISIPAKACHGRRDRDGAPHVARIFATRTQPLKTASQYEWYAHYPLGMKAGLEAKVATSLH